jgi:hypothetical protein
MEDDTRRKTSASVLRRFVLIILGTIALLGLFMLAGQTGLSSKYPTDQDLVTDPDGYVGERVTVGGTVVETNPLYIVSEPYPGETLRFAVDGYDGDVSVGDTLSVHGVLREEGVVRVDAPATASDRSSVVRKEPWERQYMLSVSFFGGL